ncbi:hypothetical protein SETIT_2G349500v2 [Setaria italica]|uniref:F-box domain-containing protein n=1 Tax=Setaria italica TaxID=4555 RepID=K3ZZG3_SETIT|nr:uncharacterized protein LOC101773593 [Setaria italica]XP_012698868.1 uncharacterized protein LOC101773593 [Setaria italica]RCV13470.1 hypothetical protein SETIT_2G349500v2 [Setaria italica]
MASPDHPSAKRIDAPAAPPPLLCLNDDLLAEIFLRLPALADVGRAATACAAFRRVVADRAFLRRLRSVHASPVLGLLLFSSIHPAEPPHSNAPFARALQRAADLSFSFVPSAGRWIPVDSRDGRVLLEREAMSGDFALCDPLSRRYLFLPQIPGRPAAQRRGRLEPFLVPASDEDSETSFRVVCVVECKPGQLVAFVFSSATGQWESLTVDAGLQPSCKFSWSSYACGCFYWKVVTGINNFLVLDPRSMEFSSVDIPSGLGQQDSVIVEAGEGSIGMFTLYNSIISAASYLVYTVRDIDEEGNSMWQFKRRVRLPAQYVFSFADAMDRHLLLRGIPWNLHLGSSTDEVDIGYFSVEFESMQIEKMCDLKHLLYAKLYTGFPPSLCVPSI